MLTGMALNRFNRRPTLGAAFLLALLLGSCGPLQTLRIEGIEPRDGSTGVPTRVSVTGEGFEDRAVLQLLDSSGSTLALDAEISEHGKTLSTVIPAGLEEGVYDVRIAGPTGDADTLPGAFTLYGGGIEIVFLDVGQGDATFIRSPRGDALLKDAGTLEAGRMVVVPFLEGRDALPPTHLIVSHRHEDHYGGMVAIMEGPDGVPGTEDDRLPSGLLLHNDPAESCSSVVCGRYDAVSRETARVAQLGESIDLGADVEARVVAVSGHLKGGTFIQPQSENAASVAIVVQFGNLRVFVGGDLTGGGFETDDMETPLSAYIPPIHVLRANHHGSASSTNRAFAENLAPAAAVISAGRDNPYCHPHSQVLSRLEMVGAHILLTNPGIANPTPECPAATTLPEGSIVANGHIRLESLDGRNYSIGPISAAALQLATH